MNKNLLSCLLSVLSLSLLLGGFATKINIDQKKDIQRLEQEIKELRDFTFTIDYLSKAKAEQPPKKPIHF